MASFFSAAPAARAGTRTSSTVRIAHFLIRPKGQAKDQPNKRLGLFYLAKNCYNKLMNPRNQNLSLGAVILGIFKDVLFFPFWWYSFGLFKTLIWLKNFISDKQKSLGLGVWVKNIFVPMYGQRDWQGMLISFFVRLVQIIGRSIAMIFWLIISFVIFWSWLLLPAAIIYGIIWQLFSQ